MVAALLLIIFVVIVSLVSSFFGGGTSGDTVGGDSNNSTRETINEDFITEPFGSTIETTEQPSMTTTSTSEDEDTAKPVKEEETRDPCRTKTGLLCKSWIYYGQNISSG